MGDRDGGHDMPTVASDGVFLTAPGVWSFIKGASHHPSAAAPPLDISLHPSLLNTFAFQNAT